ncbi:MAG: glycosyltransferase [Anaerolineae bacterium]|nr:glycosyltransferase [Anaerolineae bacterium]
MLARITAGRTRADILLASDSFSLPSLWEGLPGAILEALAAGLPIVASNIDPVMELRRYYEDRIFVANPCDIDTHVKNLQAALVKGSLIPSCALSRFEKTPFSMPRVVDAFAELYGLNKNE